MDLKVEYFEKNKKKFIYCKQHWQCRYYLQKGGQNKQKKAYLW
jgi:hypothetical protein